MKKILGGALLIIASFSLVACSNGQAGQTDYSHYEELKEEATSSVKRDTITKVYVLEKDGKTSKVELTIAEDSLLSEKAMIEGSFELLGKEEKAKIEEVLEEMKVSQEARDGVTVSYEIFENNATMTTKTDYEVIDLEEMGLSKETLDEAGEFPSAKVRISEYEAMGYSEE